MKDGGHDAAVPTGLVLLGLTVFSIKINRKLGERVGWAPLQRAHRDKGTRVGREGP
jgi:hypothetical protein